MNDLMLTQIPITELINQIRDVVRQEFLSSSQATTEQPEIICGKELCNRLGITGPTLIKWRQKNKIPFLIIGKSIRYNWPNVVKKLENKK